ncbi:MAG: redoxin domain-containing protein [Chloroflexota bacterium]|jgi:peroxiredoxin (alkyl hydroperoxide reductase subunit C)
MIKRFFRRNNQSNEELPTPLQPGMNAPDFVLPSSMSRPISLREFRGRPVVLAFYPADYSPVCSNQLALYNEGLHLFEEHDAQILGISADDLSSHQQFSESLNLGFPLLADDDPAGSVASAYGVYNERDGKNERALFVVDADGIIRWSYIVPRNVNPGADGILENLENLPQGK